MFYEDLIIDIHEKVSAVVTKHNRDEIGVIQYKDINTIRALFNMYLTAIDLSHNSIIDFGCGIGLGEYIFKNIYPESSITYSCYSSKGKKHRDFFEECQHALNVNAYFYSGDSRSSLEFLTKPDIVSDTLLILRLPFSKCGLDQLIQNNILSPNCTVIADKIKNPAYDMRLSKQDLNLNQKFIRINA